MQYSHVFNPQTNTSSLNASKPTVTNIPKGQAPSDNVGKGSINNIFSRNVTNNPLGSNPSFNQGLAGVSKPNSYGAFSLDFSVPPANNSFAANSNHIGGASNTYMNPFNNSPIKSFNIFEANNSQQGVGFSSNSTQNNKSNTNIFTNNSNTSTANNFPNLFNATPPPNKFAPTYTNTLSPTSNAFSSQNVQKPLSTNSPSSQGNSAYNQIFNKNSVSPIKNAFGNVSLSSNTTQPFGTNSQTKASNPFFNRPISSHNQTNTISQNQNQAHPFQAHNSYQTQNIFQVQNHNQQQIPNPNPFQNQNSFQIPNPFNNQVSQQQPNLQDQSNTQAPQLQLQRLMKGMNLGDFMIWNSPYNLYHTNLMVEYLLENLNKNDSQRQQSIPNQFYCMFVKDSPFKHHILVKLNEMVKTQQTLKEQKQNLIKMDKQADQLIQVLASKIAAAKMCKINKIKLEETMSSIQWQLKIMKGQVYNFMQPLMQACLQNRRFTFQDPDDFDIEIAKIIQQKITMIQGNIKKIAAESIEAYNIITSLEEQHGAASKMKVIDLLNDFQELCLKFESLKDEFEGLKPYLPFSATNQADPANQPCQKVTAASQIKPILSKRAQRIDQALSNKE